MAFTPVLAAFGLNFEPLKVSSLMKHLYSMVSIKGQLDVLRIDIVKAEHVLWTPDTLQKGKYNTQKRLRTAMHLF